MFCFVVAILINNSQVIAQFRKPDRAQVIKAINGLTNYSIDEPGSDISVRSQYAISLGHSQDTLAVATLIVVLANDNIVQVRQAAAYALGEMDHPKAAPALMMALNDKSMAVQAQTAWSLAKLEWGNNPRVFEKLEYIAIGEGMEQWNLEGMGSNLNTPMGLYNTRNGIRVQALHGLGLLNTEQSKEILRGLLDDPSANIRAWAERELNK